MYLQEAWRPTWPQRSCPQDVQGFLDKLPTDPSTLPVLVICRHGADQTYTDCRVRRAKVLRALQWLQVNNHFYKDITIDEAILHQLPEDGVPPQLLSMEENSKLNDMHDEGPNGTFPQDDNKLSADSHSFLPLPKRQNTEETAIRSIVNGEDPLNWPEIAGEPINEFHSAGLASKAFPTLFPYGTGDPANPGQHCEVSLTEAFN